MREIPRFSFFLHRAATHALSAARRHGVLFGTLAVFASAAAALGGCAETPGASEGGGSGEGDAEGSDPADTEFQPNCTLGCPDIDNPIDELDTELLGVPCTSDEECLGLVGNEIGDCSFVFCGVEDKVCVVAQVDDQLACDDSNECTTESVCSGGICVAKAGATLDCFDSNFCTVDSCLPTVGCVNEPVVGPCDDGDECTQDDFCLDGVCTPGPDICPAQCGDEDCETAKGETCESCPNDCGDCSNGCTESEFPGCDDCPCSTCVCAIEPTCCEDAWGSVCVTLCEGSCGATCSGCGAANLPGCGGCECESCVCDLKPECCTESWTEECASLCTDTCGKICI